MHAPLQSVRFVGHEHLPPEQSAEGPQTIPHAPQFFRSDSTFTHPPVQSLVGAAHVARHTPPLHTWPAAQLVEQPPQCAGSLPVSTQRLLQRVAPAGHEHCPLLQSEPPAQDFPHPPQFLRLVAASTHAPPHVLAAPHPPVLQRPVMHT